jgi:mannose-6-phosphate isomerase-like protein (cupin superfamily)
MSFEVRRVVTGHDEKGHALVKSDKIMDNVSELRSGLLQTIIWTSDFPASNDGDDDAARRPVGTAMKGGTVFRIIEYGVGVAPRVHRTDSLDYIIILSGEIYMEIEGKETLLKAGDVLVQRGNIHNWTNRGPEKCVLAAVLIDAKPVTIDGKPLPAHG